MWKPIQQFGRQAGQAVLDFVYPPHCYHCDQPLDDTPRQTLCESCLSQLESTRISSPLCRVCGLPLSGQEAQGEQAECLNCRMLRPPFHSARALFPYSGPAESLVRSYKYNGNYFLGPRIINLAATRNWLPESVEKCDTIVPVPLHKKRRKERGYNQAEFIARTVGQHFSIPIQPDAIVRQRQTDQQARLSHPKRRENVRGAFDPGDANIADRRILLVDDVLTTGATAGECARTLRRAGAKRIDVLTLVRACK